jgi:VanZ family protein
MTPRRVAAALAASMMIAQTIASSFSQLPGPRGFVGLDKVLHAGAWMILGACLTVALGRPRWLTVGVAVALALGFGMLDEFHQSFVPGRDASGFDLVADFSGASVGAAIATWYSQRRWWCGASVE